MASRLASTMAVAASVTLLLAASSVATWREFEREAGAASLRVTSVETTTRTFGPGTLAHVEATVVLEVEGGLLARVTARGVALNMSLESVPLGRVVAAAGPPGRFVVEALGTLDTRAVGLAAYREALARHPSTLDVAAHGTLYFPFGQTRSVSLRDAAPAVAAPGADGEAAAFQGLGAAGPGPPPRTVK